MKLYIKQKWFSLGSRFNIYDEAGNERYTAEGEILTLVHKMHLYDPAGREVAFLRGRFSFLPRFTVEVNGLPVADICKEFTFFRPSYVIEGLNWKVDGDFWNHEFSITEGGRTVAVIRKEWFTLGDCYEMDIHPGVDEVTALAVILAIDCVLADSNAAATASTT